MKALEFVSLSLESSPVTWSFYISSKWPVFPFHISHPAISPRRYLMDDAEMHSLVNALRRVENACKNALDNGGFDEVQVKLMSSALQGSLNAKTAFSLWVQSLKSSTILVRLGRRDHVGRTGRSEAADRQIGVIPAQRRAEKVFRSLQISQVEQS
jgi:hypothetical protein